MAEIDEAWELRHVPASAGRLHLSRHRLDEKVILTLEKRRVDVHSVFEKTCVQSWTTGSTTRLTSRAVQHPSGRFFCVQDEKIVCQWDEESKTPDQWVKQTVTQPVLAILTDKHSEEPALVKSDGTVAWLSDCLSDASVAMDTTPAATPRGRRSKKAIPAASAAQTFHYHQSYVWWSETKGMMKAVVIGKEQGKKASGLTLAFYHLPKGEPSTLHTKQDLVISDTAQVMTCCLVGNESPHLLVLTSDSRLIRLDLERNSEDEELQECGQVSLEHLLLDEDHKVAMTAIDDSHVAIVGQQTAIKGQLEPAVSLWDLHYGFRLAAHVLPDVKLEDPHWQAVWCGGAVILACGLTVSAVSCTCRPSSLSSVLSQVLSTPRLSSSSAVPQSPAVVSVAEWTCQEEVGDSSRSEEAGDRLLADLANPKKTSSAASFSELLDRYLKHLSSTSACPRVDAKSNGLLSPPNHEHKIVNDRSAKKRRKEANDQLLDHLASTVLENMLIIPQYAMAAILKRCLGEKQLWSRDLVAALVRTGQVSYRLTPELFTTLADKKEYELLSLCLQHVPDVPEAALVMAISSFLRGVGEATSKSDRHRLKTFLSSSLLCAHNDLFLRDSLRNLPINSVLGFLRFLHQKLTKDSPLSDEHSSKATINADLFKAVLTWVSLLLDVHFMQLLMFEDAQQLLAELRKTVMEQMAVCHSLSRIDSLLNAIKNKSVQCYRTNSFDHYRIEVLRL